MKVQLPPDDSHENVKVEILQITPELAMEWLDQNTINRKLQDSRVEFYANEMQAGRWTFTGEAIQRTRDGKLLNGQHRLWAVVQSAMTIPFLVVQGLSQETQMAMDGGAKRGANDALTLLGYSYTSPMAAAARIAILIERDDVRGLNAAVSSSEIAQWVGDHPDFPHAVEMANRHVKGNPAKSNAVICYAVWRFNALDPYETERFLIDLQHGANLDYGDPVLALRRRFTEARIRKVQMQTREQVALVFRAWNARHSGETLTTLRTPMDGKSIKIPEPVMPVGSVRDTGGSEEADVPAKAKRRRAR